ncbi:MAG: ribosome silencing factor [Piscirickettsiaceae bacterium]|nr:MAG: ribosome silencing factor [Piscirickettsiaceae bacterium]
MSKQLISIVMDALDDMKGKQIEVLDVRDKCSFTDTMIIVTGSSRRHVKSLAETVVIASKAKGIQPLGVEGASIGDWVLVDLGDLVLHVLRAETREFYQLEKLWSVDESQTSVI